MVRFPSLPSPPPTTTNRGAVGGRGRGNQRMPEKLGGGRNRGGGRWVVPVILCLGVTERAWQPETSEWRARRTETVVNELQLGQSWRCSEHPNGSWTSHKWADHTLRWSDHPRSQRRKARSKRPHQMERRRCFPQGFGPEPQRSAGKVWFH